MHDRRPPRTAPGERASQDSATRERIRAAIWREGRDRTRKSLSPVSTPPSGNTRAGTRTARARVLAFPPSLLKDDFLMNRGGSRTFEGLVKRRTPVVQGTTRLASR